MRKSKKVYLNIGDRFLFQFEGGVKTRRFFVVCPIIEETKIWYLINYKFICYVQNSVSARCLFTAIMTSKFLCENWFWKVDVTFLGGETHPIVSPHDDAVSASISTKPANLLLFRSHFVCKYFQQCVFSRDEMSLTLPTIKNKQQIVELKLTLF